MKKLIFRVPSISDALRNAEQSPRWQGMRNFGFHWEIKTDCSIYVARMIEGTDQLNKEIADLC